MGKDNKVIGLPGVDNPGKFDLKAWEKVINDLIAMAPSLAKIYRTRYLSLVKEGFTKEEALSIIIARGLEA